jgi:hypothetical protein
VPSNLTDAEEIPLMQLNSVTIIALIAIVACVAFLVMRRRRG